MRWFATTIAVLASALVTTGGAFAQETRPAAPGRQLNWAEQMFDKLNHDFGTVARGADVSVRFKITNKYEETIQISDAYTSCNCIQARLLTPTLKTWEEGIVELKLNTLQYSRERNANLIVRISHPAYMEVVIPIHAYIRTDVVITPGSAVMGTVAQGESNAEQRLQINYVGSPTWAISEVKSRNPNIRATVRETSRVPNGGNSSVAYELSVKLAPETPAGDLRDQLILVTNDANSPQIPVLVEGRVIAEFSVTPPAIVLKGLKPGDKEEVRIVVRGQKPFVVEKIESNSGSEAYQVKMPQKDRFQIVQILNVIVNAPSQPGPLEEVFTLTLAGQNGASKRMVEFKLNGKVVAEAKSSTEAATPQAVTTAKPVAPAP